MCPRVHVLQDLLDIAGDDVLRQTGYEFLSMSRAHFHFALRRLWFEYPSPPLQPLEAGLEVESSQRGVLQTVWWKTECVNFLQAENSDIQLIMLVSNGNPTKSVFEQIPFIYLFCQNTYYKGLCMHVIWMYVHVQEYIIAISAVIKCRGGSSKQTTM